MAKKAPKQLSDKPEKKAPKSPMGSGAFANLPKEAMMKKFSGNWEKRGGIRNSPLVGLDEMSDVDEYGY